MKANTIIKPIKGKEVIPVRHVTQIRYENSDTQGDSGSFRQALEMAKKQAVKTSASQTVSKRPLETMAGMNQYDSHAREVFFMLTSQTDYKC